MHQAFEQYASKLHRRGRKPTEYHRNTPKAVKSHMKYADLGGWAESGDGYGTGHELVPFLGFV